MTRQLAFSSTISVMVMAAFALSMTVKAPVRDFVPSAVATQVVPAGAVGGR